MADVASKQQTTALFLSTIVTRTRRNIDLIKKTDKPDGKPVLFQRIFSSVFCAISLHISTAQFNLECMGPFTVPRSFCYSSLLKNNKDISEFIKYGTKTALVIIFSEYIHIFTEYMIKISNFYHLICNFKQKCPYLNGTTHRIVREITIDLIYYSIIYIIRKYILIHHTKIINETKLKSFTESKKKICGPF